MIPHYPFTPRHILWQRFRRRPLSPLQGEFTKDLAASQAWGASVWRAWDEAAIVEAQAEGAAYFPVGTAAFEVEFA